MINDSVGLLVYLSIYISIYLSIYLSISYFQFKFATKLDVFLIVFGLTIAFFSGGAMPIMTIFFGDTLQVDIIHL